MQLQTFLKLSQFPRPFLSIKQTISHFFERRIGKGEEGWCCFSSFIVKMVNQISFALHTPAVPFFFLVIDRKLLLYKERYSEDQWDITVLHTFLIHLMFFYQQLITSVEGKLRYIKNPSDWQRDVDSVRARCLMLGTEYLSRLYESSPFFHIGCGAFTVVLSLHLKVTKLLRSLSNDEYRN